MQACADETAATLSSDPHLDTNSHGSLSLSYSLSKRSISSFTFMSCVSWDLRASASIRTARSSRTPSGCRGTLPEAPVVDLRDHIFIAIAVARLVPKLWNQPLRPNVRFH